jgi:glutathione-specific gamma-glutamylcyclotransferase
MRRSHSSGTSDVPGQSAAIPALGSPSGSGPSPAGGGPASGEPRPDGGGASVWIFGYGSLLWRPSFVYLERRPAQLSGWSRVFWQGSTDHRGVPGAPGRVVTLTPEVGAACLGAAYRVAPEVAARVLAALDHRERGGYTRADVELALHDGDPAGTPARTAALTYIAHPDNPNYLGPASLEAIAAQVRLAQGPSGTNLDYVLRLAESIRELAGEDAALFALESLLRGAQAA